MRFAMLYFSEKWVIIGRIVSIKAYEKGEPFYGNH